MLVVLLTAIFEFQNFKILNKISLIQNDLSGKFNYFFLFTFSRCYKTVFGINLQIFFMILAEAKAILAKLCKKRFITS